MSRPHGPGRLAPLKLAAIAPIAVTVTTCRPRTWTALLLAGIAAALLPGSALAGERLVVGFAPGVSEAGQVEALARAGQRSRSRVRRAGTPLPSVLAAATVEVSGDAGALARELASRDDIAFVERDHVARVTWTPNDPRLSQQWALGAIRAQQAWGTSVADGTTIAVIDTGVDYTHPDLIDKVDLGRDYVDGNNDPRDENGHGTHVAGTAAAATDNGIGIAGVAPGARILAIRALDANGSGYYSWIASAIIEAADARAEVINLSLGGSQDSRLLERAVHYAQLRGSVLTCAAGNEGASNLGYPARYGACLAIGATTQQGQVAGFSNRGPGLFLTAPGAGILATVPGTGYGTMSGTSMAAPVVAGVAALLRAQGLDGRQVEATLRRTARDRGPAGYDTTWGHGMVDAHAAVQAAAIMPTVDPPAPAAAPSIASVTAGPLAYTTASRRVQRWQRVRASRWQRIRRAPMYGSYRWTQTRQRGARREVRHYRTARGFVWERRVRFQRVQRVQRTRTAWRDIRIGAGSPLGLRAAGVLVDGRWVGSDWTPADGLSVRWRCTPGTRDVEVFVVDAAGSVRRHRGGMRITC